MQCFGNKTVLVEYGTVWTCHSFPCIKVTEFIPVLLFKITMMAAYSSSPSLHHRPPPVTAAPARLYVYFCASVCLSLASLLQIVCMQMHRKQRGRMSLSASALKAEVERWREKPAQDWRWTFVLWDCSYIWCLCYTASCSEVKSCWMLNLQSISGLCVEPSEETINTATLWCKPEERESGADTDLYLSLQQ